MSVEIQEFKIETTNHVLCLKGRKSKTIDQDKEVYIGREVKTGGWNLEGTKYGNPFRLRKYSFDEADRVVLLFFLWILGLIPSPKDIPDYIGKPEQIREECKIEMKDKDVCCWCMGLSFMFGMIKNDRCHGDVYMYLVYGVLSPRLDQILKKFDAMEILSLPNEFSPKWTKWCQG